MGYNTSGVYTETLTNVAGCDSLITLDLTINNSNASIETVSSCETYSWAANGNTYTSSGTYYDTLTNVTGCDSLVTLNLTILNNSMTRVIVVSCDNYTWTLNGTAYQVSGTYTDTTMNSNGCDSIVTLDLTINSSSSDTLNEVSCGIYTAPDGALYSTSGQYQAIISNSDGCDSILTINLLVNNTDTSITRLGSELHAVSNTGYLYQWIDCDNGNSQILGAVDSVFTPLRSGNYAVEIENGNCLERSSCISVTNVGVIELILQNVSLYPNPVENVLNVRNPSAVSLSITITDITGRLFYQGLVKQENNEIDFSNSSSGIYLVSIESEGVKRMETVVVK
jgi:hypothetical protein